MNTFFKQKIHLIQCISLFAIRNSVMTFANTCWTTGRLSLKTSLPRGLGVTKIRRPTGNDNRTPPAGASNLGVGFQINSNQPSARGSAKVRLDLTATKTGKEQPACVTVCPWDRLGFEVMSVSQGASLPRPRPSRHHQTEKTDEISRLECPRCSRFRGTN